MRVNTQTIEKHSFVRVSPGLSPENFPKILFLLPLQVRRSSSTLSTKKPLFRNTKLQIILEPLPLVSKFFLKTFFEKTLFKSLLLNKFIAIDLKNLTKWLNANKISLNVSRTEMVLFRPKKSMNLNLKIKLNGKRLYETNEISVKYLGIRIDNKLYWKAHINDIALKIIITNAIFYKVRDFVDATILKSIYYALFESHIHYVCIIWRRNVCTINQLFILQKKALRLIHF